ncbi:uncharacterized protein LOC106942512 [Poecilia latipinna]|uniref:uncharacterized protein LOC106942512 n=1 Tax=Poecilia latipinna TaxID=48699 RepID=UPI00072ECD44|nr:PREDICTED: uncharacterized protein LOC106942512 [Poecilia latipinna]XP_014881300.1 PREDICTED: uncharacterized protein LOC106942512 [Poecilia latipinna]XP_016519871.1 PREDICTED: uncharacterized protein LOC107833939 [Poecilia formosa]
MVPGQEKHQQGDRLEAHTMALPADGSPTLEGNPDNGKEHGKVWLNEADVVSEDHGEELRYSSALQSVDCSTSSIGDEVGNEDQDDLRPEKSRPIATLQHHQVGLEEKGASLTSRRARRITNMVYAAKEEDPPSKLSFGTVLPSSFKFTPGLDKQEEPILRPEDSGPIGVSPQPLGGWKSLVASLTFGRARRATKKVDAAKADDPSSKPLHQVGMKEDAAHVTSVTGINGKRRKDSDSEEQPPAKRIRENQADDEFPSKRTRDTVSEEEPPAKRTKIGLPPSGDLFSVFRARPLPEKDLRAKRTRDSVANVLSSRKDPGLSPPVLSPSCKIARKRPILSPRVFRPPPRMMPCDMEEEPKPSTSSGITARESSRHVWFRPRYVLSSDSE